MNAAAIRSSFAVHALKGSQMMSKDQMEQLMASGANASQKAITSSKLVTNVNKATEAGRIDIYG